MKFKYFLGILLIPVSFLKVQAQAKLKGDLMINAGISRCDHFDKLYDIGLRSDVDIVHEKQIAINLINFNVIYLFNADKYKLKPLVGVSFMPHGFIEKGFTTDSLTKLPYQYAFKLSYTSLFGGIRYRAIESGPVKVDIAQMLLPMFRSDNVAHMKTIALSTRTEIFINFRMKNNGIMAISPFFQTGLVKFNTSRRNGNGTDYKPFSYGLNLGTYFKL
jgi:hypothetical protein